MMERVGKYITNYIKGKTPKVLFPDEEADTMPYLSPDYLRGVATPEFYAKQDNKSIVVDNGEVIVLWDGSNAGEILISKKGVLASTMTMLQFDETQIDKAYFGYSFQNLEYILKAKTAGSGIPHADKGVISKLEFYKPSLPEQTAIAALLSKVDESIAAVQRSIAAAERLKKSLMQNLLTGRMKPDGTLRKEDEFYVDEKFGRVPLGWDVKTIGDKDVCKINPVYKYKKKDVYDFIPMEAIKENFEGVDYVEKQVIDNGSYTRFKAGDILFAKITPCSENGKVAYIDHIDSEVGFASTEFIVFHPTENVDGKYVYLLLSSGNVHRLAISLMEGTTGRQRIPWKIFRNRIFVPMPDKVEQTKIVDKILAFDKQIKENNNKIAVLERLKKSLMQNLLTGRVRVLF